MTIFQTDIDTPMGPMLAWANEKGICLLIFKDQHRSEKFKIQLEAEINLDPDTENKYLQWLKQEMAQYFEGHLESFTVPLDLIGTDFQIKVWKSLKTIPLGETRSYKEQALALGNLRAIRAVATANGANNISIIIPCHRIIGSDGSLTGYAGGLDKKRWLLDFELQRKPFALRG